MRKKIKIIGILLLVITLIITIISVLTINLKAAGEARHEARVGEVLGEIGNAWFINPVSLPEGTDKIPFGRGVNDEEYKTWIPLLCIDGNEGANLERHDIAKVRDSSVHRRCGSSRRRRSRIQVDSSSVGNANGRI